MTIFMSKIGEFWPLSLERGTIHSKEKVDVSSRKRSESCFDEPDPKSWVYQIKIKIWDSQIEDGDVVSIYLGDKLVLTKHRLTTKPEEFEFELPVGVKEHYLTVYADDFGRSEPNTAAIIISDGVKEQRIDLTAGRKKQESVKIITE